MRNVHILRIRINNHRFDVSHGYKGDQLGLAIKNPLRFKLEAIKHFEVLDNQDNSKRLLSIYKCKNNEKR